MDLKLFLMSVMVKHPIMSQTITEDGDRKGINILYNPNIANGFFVQDMWKHGGKELKKYVNNELSDGFMVFYLLFIYGLSSQSAEESGLYSCILLIRKL